MSAAVLCEGCGQRVPIPDDYRRNKIQCPACGVIVPVPAAARREDSAPAPEPRPSSAAPARARSARPAPPPPETEEILWDPDESVVPEETPEFLDPPAEPPAPAPRRPAPEMLFTCRRCGLRQIRRQGECPDCDGFRTTPEVPWLSVDSVEPEDEDDGKPYIVTGGDEPKCPECHKVLTPGAVLCVACGFHLKKREKVVQTYQPIDRTWETNYSFKTRLTIFLCVTGATLVMGLSGTIMAGGDLLGFGMSWFVFVDIMAFLLGTFDRIHLRRDSAGRVEVHRTWRFCFFERQPTRIKVRGHVGVIISQWQAATFWEWLVFFFLLLSGIVPGLLWWYYAIHKTTFQVALTGEHCCVREVVYRGWTEMQAKEIAHNLCNAAGLRLEGA
jgi:ribosomal protein L37E